MAAEQFEVLACPGPVPPRAPREYDLDVLRTGPRVDIALWSVPAVTGVTCRFRLTLPSRSSIDGYTSCDRIMPLDLAALTG